VIPRINGLDPYDVLTRSPAALEPFRRLALQIRRTVPRPGARVLVVGATPGEGATFTAACVAACLARQDERVAIIDANLRRVGSQAHPAADLHADHRIDDGVLLPRKWEQAVAGRARGLARRILAWVPAPVTRLAARVEPWVRGLLAGVSAGASWVAQVVRGGGRGAPAHASFDIVRLVPGAAPAGSGLEHFLGVEDTPFEQVVRQSAIPGVDVIAPLGAAAQPDLVGTNRMRQLLYEASSRYGVVLVDAPAGLSSADAEALAPWVDGIVLVVRSQQVDARWARAVAERLAATGTTLIGAVLNGTDRRYMLRNEVVA